ncbi:MAG: MFS transporter [Pseudomonadales bacterium]|nr:MFS transporter [Pseudomonadales bacterium]
MPLFYGWVIVAFTFIVQFVTVGLGYYAFSLYLKPLTETLGTERFWVALALMIQAIVIAALSPLAGKLYTTQPIKPLLFIGLASLGLGLLLMPQIDALWQLYVLFGGLVGIGVVFLGTIPCNVMLANWFEKRRGAAMGISQFGITISATILVPAVTWIVMNYDWQTAFAITGTAAIGILAPLIHFLAVRSPAEKNQYPDGVTPLETLASVEDTEEWTFLRAVKNRDIWLITLTIGPCYLSIAAIVITMPSHFTDLGFSAMDAAYAVSLTTLMGAIAKPLMGTLSDHFNKKFVMAAAIAMQAGGVLLLIEMTSYSTLLLAGFLFGLGYGGVAPLWAILLATRFGRGAFAQIMGHNMPMLTPFTMSGLPFATFIFGLYGSYLPAYMTLLAGFAVAAVALTFLKLEPNNGAAQV